MMALKSHYLQFQNLFDCSMYGTVLAAIILDYQGHLSDDLVDLHIPMFVILWLNLIFTHMSAFKATRFFIAMTVETIKGTLPFFTILFLFIFSYTHLMIIFNTVDENGKKKPSDIGLQLRIAYSLSLGNTDDFKTYSWFGFFVFLLYTLMITLVLMNLVIAIMSDKYEEVTANQDATVGRVMLTKSIESERLARMFRTTEAGKTFFLFISEPLAFFEEGETSAWTGMIGSVLQKIESRTKSMEKNVITVFNNKVDTMKADLQNNLEVKTKGLQD